MGYYLHFREFSCINVRIRQVPRSAQSVSREEPAQLVDQNERRSRPTGEKPHRMGDRVRLFGNDGNLPRGPRVPPAGIASPGPAGTACTRQAAEGERAALSANLSVTIMRPMTDVERHRFSA